MALHNCLSFQEEYASVQGSYRVDAALMAKASLFLQTGDMILLNMSIRLARAGEGADDRDASSAAVCYVPVPVR